MAEVILVTGGARSGKSTYALSLAEPFRKRVFVATAEAFDSEMQDRILLHRAERGPDWETIEAPLELGVALRENGAHGSVIVVDCLTVWLGNVMYHRAEGFDETQICHELLDSLDQSKATRIVLVTNEVGMGIVPDNPLARRFRDVAGRLNQRIAQRAEQVVLVVCGQPLVIKKTTR